MTYLHGSYDAPAPCCGTTDTVHEQGCPERRHQLDQGGPIRSYREPRPEAEVTHRTSCRWCRKILARYAGSDEWTSAAGPGLTGRSRECASAPNPDDGPMPPHEPGTAIVARPAS